MSRSARRRSKKQETQGRARVDYVIRHGLVVPADMAESEMDEYQRFLLALDEEEAPVTSICTTTKQPKQTYPSGAPGGGGSTNGYSGFGGKALVCWHCQDLVRVGTYEILVSGSHDVTDSELDKMRWHDKKNLDTPDLGVYLDASGWASKMKMPIRIPPRPSIPALTLNGDVPTGLEMLLRDAQAAIAEWEVKRDAAAKEPSGWRWPHVLVGWPDQGVIDGEVAGELSAYVLAQLKAGKIVDIGCAGAHGRTGTFLAMLIIDAEGLEPEDAINAVRKRHCTRAIESGSQVRAIFRYAGKTATEKEVERLR